MQGGDSGDFWYAYHAYHKAGLLPSDFANLPVREKAILVAFTKIESEEIEKNNRKMKKGG